jgi:hypothetical protein
LKPHARIVLAGLILYGTAWFVQVIKDGATLADGILPGWQALRVALSPIWPYEGIGIDGWLRRILSVASGFTNAIVLCMPVWLQLARRHRKAFAVGPLCVAAGVDAHWMFPEPQDLRLGYYMWLGSFIVLAVGVARSADTPRPLRAPAA